MKRYSNTDLFLPTCQLWQVIINKSLKNRPQLLQSQLLYNDRWTLSQKKSLNFSFCNVNENLLIFHDKIHSWRTPPQGNLLQLNTPSPHTGPWTHPFWNHIMVGHFHLALFQSVRGNILRRVGRLKHLLTNKVVIIEDFLVLPYYNIRLVEVNQSILCKINLFHRIIWFSCIKVADIFQNFFPRDLSRLKTIFKCNSNGLSANIFVIFSCSSSHWNKICLLKAWRNLIYKKIKFWWAQVQFFCTKNREKETKNKRVRENKVKVYLD